MTELIEDVNYIKAEIVRGEQVANEKRDPQKEPNRKDEQRLYLEFPIYKGTYTIGVPDKRELQQYLDGGREYYDHMYHVWRNFLQDTQRNQHYIIPKMMFRARLIIKGKIQDVYAINIQARGYDNVEREQNYDMNIGIYNRITFMKERDMKTGDLKIVGKDKAFPVYEFYLDRNNPDSMNALKYWYEHSEGDMQYYVYPMLSGGDRPLQIMDFDTFANANHMELIQCGKNNATLPEFKDMFRYFTANPSFKTKVQPS